MEIQELFEKALTSKYLIIAPNDLTEVLNSVETIRIEDTLLSDFIRLFKYNNKFFVQETTFNQEILIRKMNSLEEADFFIKDRLEFYERKWDGCGCKIAYYQ